MKSIPSSSAIDLLIADYQQYLLSVAGLQPSTCEKWTFFVELFLKAQFKPKTTPLPLQELTARQLLDFVLEQSRHSQPGRLQSMASALRSFCRYLCVSGRHPQDLSAALPPISGHHREELPTYLSSAQLEQLLDGLDRRTLLGRRDYALVLCLARLGLRAAEVAHLTLEDVDWRQGCLRLRAPKGRRERQLPLTPEVGQALAAYLKRAPRSPGLRTVFCTDDGQRSLHPAWLSQRVGLAMARAGLGPPGRRAHLLRRTLASHLVQQGASLKAVADVLGHASLSTTQVYAKVNLPLLRQVAQPWPQEVRP